MAQQQYLRIKLVGDNISNLNSFVEEISAICDKLGVTLKGPIPMPTKKLKVTTRKSPCGDGKASFERYQMRIHKRLMDVQINDRVIRMIMKVPIPTGLNIELKVI
ncbi:MAG: 30S ribosomal protein S10 [Nanoarchaeota archaeon]|nr:30S ribosomal protein S10 [Nanoarchaeota archaeon]